MYTVLSYIFLIAAFMSKQETFRFIGFLLVAGVYAIAGALYASKDIDKNKK